MCPLSVIDYVVVHELSNITYKDHSPAFLVRVKTLLLDYEDRQNWLKTNSKADGDYFSLLYCEKQDKAVLEWERNYIRIYRARSVT